MGITGFLPAGWPRVAPWPSGGLSTNGEASPIESGAGKNVGILLKLSASRGHIRHHRERAASAVAPINPGRQSRVAPP